jgi:uncharacterized membrane protein required for colicin V production
VVRSNAEPAGISAKARFGTIRATCPTAGLKAAVLFILCGFLAKTLGVLLSFLAAHRLA